MFLEHLIYHISFDVCWSLILKNYLVIGEEILWEVMYTAMHYILHHGLLCIVSG